MKTPIKYITTIILILGLSNCSSSFFTITPDEESFLDQGRREIEKETDLTYSSISLEDKTKEEFILNFYAYNKSQDKIVVDPKIIYYKAYDENRKPISKQRKFAYDPEKQIELLNDDLEDREDTHDAVTGLNIVFSLISTIVDLTDDDDNDAEEVLENVAIFANNQIGEEISYDNEIDYLKAQKLYWKNEVLRVTEISKDEDVGGIFYLPIDSDATHIKIFIPLGDDIHTYKFKQIED